MDDDFVPSQTFFFSSPFLLSFGTHFALFTLNTSPFYMSAP